MTIIKKQKIEQSTIQIIIRALLNNGYISVRDAISFSLALGEYKTIKPYIKEAVIDKLKKKIDQQGLDFMKSNDSIYLTGSYLFSLIIDNDQFYHDIDFTLVTDEPQKQISEFSHKGYKQKVMIDTKEAELYNHVNSYFVNCKSIHAVMSNIKMDVIIVKSLKDYINSFGIDIMANYYNLMTNEFYIGHPVALAKKRANISVKPGPMFDKYNKKYSERLHAIDFSVTNIMKDDNK